MLQLQSKTCMIFHRDPQRTSGSETFRLNKTKPGEWAQAPDWLLENEYFKLALNDRVTMLEVKSSPSQELPAADPDASIPLRPGENVKAGKKPEAKKSANVRVQVYPGTEGSGMIVGG